MSERSILIIDDSTQIREEIKSVLKSTDMFDKFYESSDGMEGFKMMFSNLPDIVICDLVMPGLDGLKFLKLKRARREFDKIPVLILTSMDNLGDKVRALAEGAQDYITKPFSSPELVARVKAHLRIKLLQDEVIEAKEKLEALSNNTQQMIKLLQDELIATKEKLEAMYNTDALTGLYNRKFFINLLENEFERAKSYNTPLSLLLIDMDYFRRVEEVCGPLISDKVLGMVANIFKTGLRKIDACARYGGETFATMLSNTDVAGAMSIAEAYMYEMKKQNFSDICPGIDTLTFSIGIACLPNNDIKDVKSFIKCATDALYESKRNGRNMITIFHAKQEE
ncbi:MAG: GGDEF domain-containing response regulator [bacterium]